MEQQALLEVCKMVIDKKGVDHQLFKATEELGELVQAIGAFKTKCNGLEEFLNLRHHVIEEMVDVEMVLTQLKVIFQANTNEMEEMLTYKINRLRENESL